MLLTYMSQYYNLYASNISTIYEYFWFVSRFFVLPVLLVQLMLKSHRLVDFLRSPKSRLKAA